MGVLLRLSMTLKKNLLKKKNFLGMNMKKKQFYDIIRAIKSDLWAITISNIFFHLNQLSQKGLCYYLFTLAESAFKKKIYRNIQSK